MRISKSFFNKPFLNYDERWYTRADLLNTAYEIAHQKIGRVSNSRYIIVKSRKNFSFFAYLLSAVFDKSIIIPYNDIIENRVFVNKSNEIPCINLDDKTIKDSIEKCRNIRNNNNVSSIAKKIINSKEAFLLITSSGTESGGKGIAISPKNIFAQGLLFSKHSKVSCEDYFLHILPHNYMAGIFNCFVVPFISGSKVKLHDFNLLKISSLVKENTPSKFNVNYIVVSPSLLELICSFIECEELGVYKLKVLVTGAFLYPDLVKRAENLGILVSVAFGITEMGGSFTYLEKYSESDPFNMGVIMKNIEYKCNSSNMMFFKNRYSCELIISKDVKKIFKKKVFFKSGDVGFVKNKILHIFGRESEIAKRQGVQISSNFIESIFRESPYVSDCLVVFDTHSRLGVKIISYVVLSDIGIESIALQSTDFTLNKIRVDVNEKLVTQERPDEIKIISTIPKTEFGKKIKRLM